MVQRTKVFGLKKLKKIAGRDSRWFVSPYKVYSSPEQFRLAHALGRRRLLVRGDETGRNYLRYAWPSMPRMNIELGRSPRTAVGKLTNERKVMGELAKLGNRQILRSEGYSVDQAFLKKRARFVVHPTFSREKISVTGRALLKKLGEGTASLRIHLSINPPSTSAFFKAVPLNVVVEYQISAKKWRQLSKPVSGLPKSIAGTIVKFIKKGIESRQIKLNRLETEINFLTWENAPKKIEFYDLVERRAELRPKSPSVIRNK